MEDAIGTVIIFAVVGCVFGDQQGKKVAPYLLAFGLLLAFLKSPEFAVVLILAPLAGVVMLIGAAVGFIRRL